MIFQTFWFVVFGSVFFAGYWLGVGLLIRRFWLLGGCLVFHYHFAGPAGVLPIVTLGILVYAAGLSRRRLVCYTGITLCVAALVFYKYTHFLLLHALGLLHPGLATQLDEQALHYLPSAPPLAISFFAFEYIHYLSDVAKGVKPLRRFDDFALFTLFFPSLVAGPVKRFENFIPSLYRGLGRRSASVFVAGLQRLATGIVKKVIISDNLSLAINYWDPRLEQLSPGGLWAWFAALSARILLDFSGYSDMAIGLALMMGIRLPENFNYPYFATNLQDFWQRWHMSLSGWIRDYVYIPLGGNRHGPFRKLLNGLIAFSLCGLWHGAAWNFFLWGLWHGVGLALCSTYATLLGSAGRWLSGLFRRLPFLGWCITLPYVVFGWLLFFYDPSHAWGIALRLLRGH